MTERPTPKYQACDDLVMYGSERVVIESRWYQADREEWMYDVRLCDRSKVSPAVWDGRWNNVPESKLASLPQDESEPAIVTIATTILHNDDNETCTVVTNGDVVTVTFTTDGQTVDQSIVYDGPDACEHATRLVERYEQDGWTATASGAYAAEIQASDADRAARAARQALHPAGRPIAATVMRVRDDQVAGLAQWVTELLARFTETAVAPANIVLDETITHIAEGAEHWQGEAWVTYHVYGEHVHRSYADAERWNANRRSERTWKPQTLG